VELRHGLDNNAGDRDAHDYLHPGGEDGERVCAIHGGVTGNATPDVFPVLASHRRVQLAG
jgi:hypothetical protein